MGVTGLWGLVDGVGHPINLETLQNKTLAIGIKFLIFIIFNSNQKFN
jgi:hypothetical protein